MPRFAANLTMMFTEWSFLDRFEAAAEAGFDAVEFLFPYDFPAETIDSRLRSAGLDLALFNMPPGDWESGDRGIGALPHRFAEFQSGVQMALEYVQATGVRSVHMMAGLADGEDSEARSSYLRACEFAASALASHDVDLLLEPINSRSMPGYFLNSFELAEELIRGVDASNVKLQFDVFHAQIIQGDITESFRRLLSIIGHIQIAGVPDRNEPDTGEINYGHFFDCLDRSGYRSFVGCEYKPAQSTLEGLGWFDPYRKALR